MTSTRLFSSLSWLSNSFQNLGLPQKCGDSKVHLGKQRNALKTPTASIYIEILHMKCLTLCATHLIFTLKVMPNMQNVIKSTSVFYFKKRNAKNAQCKVCSTYMNNAIRCVHVCFKKSFLTNCKLSLYRKNSSIRHFEQWNQQLLNLICQNCDGSIKLLLDVENQQHAV